MKTKIAEMKFLLRDSIVILVKVLFPGSPSSVPLRTWLSSSSVYSQWCSFQLSPVSLLKITSSLSFPLRAAKWGISTITGLIFNREACYWQHFLWNNPSKIYSNWWKKMARTKLIITLNLINAHNHRKPWCTTVYTNAKQMNWTQRTG